MNINLLIGIGALLIGIFIVIVFYNTDNDYKDILFISGFWFLLFSVPIIIYSFVHFNPKHFIWIGIVVGTLVSLINLYIWYRVAEKFSRDKYSGGGLTYYAFGCFGLIVSPLIGFAIGHILRIISQ